MIFKEERVGGRARVTIELMKNVCCDKVEQKSSRGDIEDRSGDGTGSFEVKIRTKTAKFTIMTIARFRESRYLVRESEVFIKDKTKVAS